MSIRNRAKAEADAGVVSGHHSVSRRVRGVGARVPAPAARPASRAASRGEHGMSRPPLFWLAADGPSTFGVLRQEPDWIAAVARDRLSRLLFHVARNNTFYGRRLQSAGIEWADPVLQREPYRALAALPLVSKAELRRAGLGMLDGGRLHPDWYSSSSSGSTGEPFRVYYEARAWARLKYLVKLRARAACGVRADRPGCPARYTPAGQRLDPAELGTLAAGSACFSRRHRW